MAFKKEKDVIVKMIGNFPLSKGVEAIVSINSYNGGTEKLSMVKKSYGADGEPRIRAIGRLTPEEAKNLFPAFKKAVEALS